MADVDQIVSYGGDPAIIATRSEIERVQTYLSSAANLLLGELEVTDSLNQPLKRVGLAMELPAVQQRIDYLLQALRTASNEYFDGEALIAKELTDIGLISAPVIAAGLLGVANDAGLLREHLNKVQVQEVKKFERFAPDSIAQLAQRTRLTTSANYGGLSTVTIERFGGTFLVYVPGTQTWNPISGANPLDFTSNMQAMLGPGLAASEVGVQMALTKAGAKPNSKLILIGHSQGGMVAGNIARRDPRVKAMVTFGAPIGQLAGELKIPIVALEHSNDIVPKLGLKANPMGQNISTVVREVPISKPIDALVEAHDISNYEKTAQLADESQEFGLKRVREMVLEAFGAEGAGKQGQVSVFEMRRN